uniref:Angiopoietin 4 n=1 Tax=Eptatretus burgeri TaxID=7764 RepID=A0A8C4WZJ4_EPTBU
MLLQVLATVVLLGATLSTSWCERGREESRSDGCSYTFLLPQPAAPCAPEESTVADETTRRMHDLEATVMNTSEWLLKLESFFQNEMSGVREENVHENQESSNATWLGHRTSLQDLGDDVKAKLLNQTDWLESLLLEKSLSMGRLESQLKQHTQEMHELQDQSRKLERRLKSTEEKHAAALLKLDVERLALRRRVDEQGGQLQRLQHQAVAAELSTKLLQEQQAELLQAVGELMFSLQTSRDVSPVSGMQASQQEQKQVFWDCADVYRSGQTSSGVYTIHLSNGSDATKVYCDMDIQNGGWTVIQRRLDGSLDFHRTWTDYKMGFGEPSEEHWLGNEAVHRLSKRRTYSLLITLLDWEGQKAFVLYQNFHLGNEKQNYRLHLKGFSGTAGHTSSLSMDGPEFSTKDSDHDTCSCTCSLIAGGDAATAAEEF